VHFPASPAHIGLVVQIALITAPAAALLYLERLALAAVVFYGLFVLLSSYAVALCRPLELTTLVVGCIPMLMLMRPLFYHNSVSILFALVLCVWALFSPADIVAMLRDITCKVLLMAAFAYWWLSVIYTGYYATNLRVFELVLGACCVFLLTRSRSYLSAAVWGIGISTAMIALALSKYGAERLGMAEVGTLSLGHPQQVGMGMSLMLLLSLADDARWLSLSRSRGWRYVVAGGAAGVLLLTTSRTSWLLAGTGMIVMAFTRRQRRHLVPAVILITLAAVVVLSTSRGDLVVKYFDKAASADRTWAQRTTGRSDQYAAFPSLFWQSPLVGFGPGASGSVYRREDGEYLMMHSLYLHIGIELGIIGLLVLLSIYLAVLYRAARHLRLTSEVVPLIGALAFCVDGMAHNSFNPLMGVFLGLAVADVARFHVARPVQLRVVRSGLGIGYSNCWWDAEVSSPSRRPAATGT
jgi:O-antigen ligase